MNSIVNNPKLESDLISLLKKEKRPVSIDYVRHNLDLSWGTARALLLSLALLGKINSMKTTKSWIFWIKKEAFQNES
jgi:membrane protein required for beta-lactamase induction